MNRFLNLLTPFCALLCFFNIHTAIAQEERHVCGNDVILQEKLAEDPHYLEKLYEQEAQYREQYELMKAAQTTTNNGNGKRIIPVVFHIIHQFGNENIPASAIHNQMRDLNDYFSADVNTDVVRAPFDTMITDMEVEFRLATKDPDGNCTDGINRFYDPERTNNVRNEPKEIVQWDPSKYLNVWIVNSIRGGGNTGIVLGFAQFPQTFSSSPQTDGIVMIASRMLSSNNTFAHEVGHIFWLYHPFQGGCHDPNLCESRGDLVCDTPPSANQNFGCDLDLNSCADSPRDNVENIMDYSNCGVMFTPGQKARMNRMFDIFEFRANLYSEENLIATGTADPYEPPTCGPVADFSLDEDGICEGGPSSIRDRSYRSTPTDYTWILPGTDEGTVTGNVPNATYTEPGLHDVTLIVSNQYGSDTLTRTEFVNVIGKDPEWIAPIVQDIEATSFDDYSWSVSSSASTNRTWEITDRAAFTGTHSLFFNNMVWGERLESYEAITPPISLEGIEDPILNFNLAYARRATNSTDFLRIAISEDCGLNYDNVLTLRGSMPLMESVEGFRPSTFEPEGEEEWNNVAIALEDYANAPEIRVRFDFLSNQGNNIFIDNIRFGSVTSREAEEAAFNLQIFPNPVGSFFAVRFAVEEARVPLNMVIRNALGQEVYRKNFGHYTQGEHQIEVQRNELQNATSGVYIVELFQDREVVRKKLIFE